MDESHLERASEAPAVHDGPAGHELSDARIRPLAIFLAGLTVSLLVVVGLNWLFFEVLRSSINNEPADRRAAGSRACRPAAANR